MIVDSKSLLYEKQFGLQRNNSIEHVILQFGKGEYTPRVFIDLSKAFDTVGHIRF